MSQDFSWRELRLVARSAISILYWRYGLTCCLFGSMACMLYGNSRTPNDVDIIVMTNSHTAEDLKSILSRYPNFYLRPSRIPGETYNVLFYQLDPLRFCKVDILVPGTINIPFMPKRRLVWRSGFLVPPILVLLILKVQGWSHHRDSPRADMQQKQHVDIEDIDELVYIAACRGAHVSQLSWLPIVFGAIGRTLLRNYVSSVRPEETWPWKDLGVNVP